MSSNVISIGSVADVATRMWATRPADERFETLDALHQHALDRRMRSLDYHEDQAAIRVEPREDDIVITTPTGFPVTPTHWAFGQLAAVAKAPAPFLRQLPARLTADCLNHQLRKTESETVKIMTLADPDGDRPVLQAVTGKDYGRIWNADVTAALKRVIEASDGKWFNPPTWQKHPDGSPVMGGLYDSDRLLFTFFIDGGSIVNAGRTAAGEDDLIHRGFFVWNSEVGAKTIGAAMFLFRAVCGNHMIWDMRDVKVFETRHSLYAPERFASEIYPSLEAQMNASPKPVEDAIRAAKKFMLPTDTKALTEWGVKHGFTRGEVKEAVAAAQREEGDCRTLYQFIQGATSYSKRFAWADARADLDRRAGALFDLVAA